MRRARGIRLVCPSRLAKKWRLPYLAPFRGSSRGARRMMWFEQCESHVAHRAVEAVSSATWSLGAGSHIAPHSRVAQYLASVPDTLTRARNEDLTRRIPVVGAADRPRRPAARPRIAGEPDHRSV